MMRMFTSLFGILKSKQSALRDDVNSLTVKNGELRHENDSIKTQHIAAQLILLERDEQITSLKEERRELYRQMRAHEDNATAFREFVHSVDPKAVEALEADMSQSGGISQEAVTNNVTIVDAISGNGDSDDSNDMPLSIDC